MQSSMTAQKLLLSQVMADWKGIGLEKYGCVLNRLGGHVMETLLGELLGFLGS